MWQGFDLACAHAHTTILVSPSSTSPIGARHTSTVANGGMADAHQRSHRGCRAAACLRQQQVPCSSQQHAAYVRANVRANVQLQGCGHASGAKARLFMRHHLLLVVLLVAGVQLTQHTGAFTPQPGITCSGFMKYRSTVGLQDAQSSACVFDTCTSVHTCPPVMHKLDQNGAHNLDLRCVLL